MWKEITGQIGSTNNEQPFIDQLAVVDSGKEYFLKRERKRKGILFKTQPEISSYLEIVSEDLVRPHVRLHHKLQVYVGFAPTSEHPLSTVIPVGWTGTVSTIPKEIVQQDIWVANQNGEIRGIAWFNHCGERIKPLFVQRGKSYYRSEEDERAQQNYLAQLEEQWEKDRKRFSGAAS